MSDPAPSAAPSKSASIRRYRPRKGRQPAGVQCPKCRYLYDPNDYLKEQVVCPKCRTKSELHLFPAFFEGAVRGNFAEPLQESGEAACYFHPVKQAEVSCHECGRLICQACNTAPVSETPICAACFNRAVEAGQYPRNILNPGSAALLLALLPVLLFFIFWISLFTAPMAFYLSIAGWRKAGEVQTAGRARLVTALIFSFLQLGAWIFFFTAITSEFFQIMS